MLHCGLLRQIVAWIIKGVGHELDDGVQTTECIEVQDHLSGWLGHL